MCGYKSDDSSNIVEICVDTELTADVCSSVTSKLIADMAKHGQLRVLEEIQEFEGLNPVTLWSHASLGLAHLKNITHAAIVVDGKWIDILRLTRSSILSPMPVRIFKRSQLAEARVWLAEAQ